MKEVTSIRYEAEDGKIFDTQEECLAHEKDVKDSKKVTQKFNDIIDYCKEHFTPCEDDGFDDWCDNNECPFYNARCGHDCTFMCIPCIDFTKLEI